MPSPVTPLLAGARPPRAAAPRRRSREARSTTLALLCLLVGASLGGCGDACGSCGETTPSESAATARAIFAEEEAERQRHEDEQLEAARRQLEQRERDERDADRAAGGDGRPGGAVAADGYAVLALAAGGRQIHVSNQGNDANSGLSPDTPKRTIAAAKELLRHGYPDQLLLRRGDRFAESLGAWRTSGRSARAPMVVTAYGDGARPVLATGNRSGLETSGAGGSPPSIDFVTVSGLHFLADGYDGRSDVYGVSLLRGGRGWTFEDTVFEGYYTNLSIQGVDGPHRDVMIRRCIVIDAYRIGETGHSQGIYVANTHGLLIEGTLFDHNGWSERVRGAVANIYRHNVYIDNGNTGVVFRGNVVANAPSHGIQLRPGGVVEGNLFLRNSIHILVGGGTDPEPGGVFGEAKDNVVLGAKDIAADAPRGWAIEAENLSDGAIVGNVVAHANGGGMRRAIHVTRAPAGGSGRVRVEGNVVWDWNGVIDLDFDGAIRFARNVVHATRGGEPVLRISPAARRTLVSEQNRFATPDMSRAFDVAGAVGDLASFAEATADTTTREGAEGASRPGATLADYLSSHGLEATDAAFLGALRRRTRGDGKTALDAASLVRWFQEAYGATSGAGR